MESSVKCTEAFFEPYILSAFCRPSFSRPAFQVFIPLGFGCGVGTGGRILTPLVLKILPGVGRCTGYQRGRSRSFSDPHFDLYLDFGSLSERETVFLNTEAFFATWLTSDHLQIS